jgi:hypothetical protein
LVLLQTCPEPGVVFPQITVEFQMIQHPAFPLLSSCRLICLNHFGLRPPTWRALRRELEYGCTVGELMESYKTDLTAIRGIGPSRASELEAVLAAAGYPSPLDVSRR